MYRLRIINSELVDFFQVFWHPFCCQNNSKLVEFSRFFIMCSMRLEAAWGGGGDKERFQPRTASAKQIVAGLQRLLTQQGWEATGGTCVALLYLIGKGKSPRLPAISWWHICAIARPIVPRCRLHIAARAFSCFMHEITGYFHHHSVHFTATWYTWLDSWSSTHVTEVDCNDPCNNVDPAFVVKDLNESIEWLKTKR